MAKYMVAYVYDTEDDVLQHMDFAPTESYCTDIESIEDEDLENIEIWKQLGIQSGVSFYRVFAGDQA